MSQYSLTSLLLDSKGERDREGARYLEVVLKAEHSQFPARVHAGVVMKAQNLRDRLGQWETHLAPLTSRQKDGYLQLSAVATSRPLPTSTKVRVHYHSPCTNT